MKHVMTTDPVNIRELSLTQVKYQYWLKHGKLALTLSLPNNPEL